MRDALSRLERELLAGRTSIRPRVKTAGVAPRLLGLMALAQGNDLNAVALLRNSRDALETGSLEWAISERLYGLALIRVQREVEGTFALERADPVLEAHGFVLFLLE